MSIRIDGWLSRWKGYPASSPRLSGVRTSPSRSTSWVGRGGHPVATLGLRSVQRHVGLPQELVGRTDTHRAAYADGDRNGVVTEVDGVRSNRCSDPLGQRQCSIEIGLRRDDHELLPAPPSGEVAVADRRLDPAGELPQHLVASEMPLFVVDPLEVIDVQHQDGEWLAVAVSGVDRRL